MACKGCRGLEKKSLFNKCHNLTFITRQECWTLNSLSVFLSYVCQSNNIQRTKPFLQYIGCSQTVDLVTRSQNKNWGSGFFFFLPESHKFEPLCWVRKLGEGKSLPSLPVDDCGCTEQLPGVTVKQGGAGEELKCAQATDSTLGTKKSNQSK